MTDLVRDRRHLVEEAYAGRGKLDARVGLYGYGRPVVDQARWILDQVEWRGDEVVLDVGCGYGRLLAPVTERLPAGGRVFGADVSVGMLREAEGAPVVAADARALPLRKEAIDVVLAVHMLFHVPDVSSALAEFVRVLKPGAVLLAATNAEDDKQALLDAYTTAVVQAGAAQPPATRRWCETFSMDNGGDLLDQVFRSVEVRQLRSTLMVPGPAPILAYLESSRSVREPELPAGVRWHDVMTELEGVVVETIARDGAFRVDASSGVFVCRKAGP